MTPYLDPASKGAPPVTPPSAPLLATASHRIAASLNAKFMVGTAAGLILCSLLFLLLFVGMYSQEMARARGDAAQQVSRLLQVSLENAMLKRDLEGLKFIVERLGAQEGVRRVMIANPDGEVRFASDAGLLGQRLWEGAVPYAETSARFRLDQTGREVLSSITPVHNREPCTQCHGPVSGKPINGVLHVDYDAEPIRRHAFTTTLVLMGAGAVVTLATLIGGWWFMRRFVLAPVARLVAVSGALSGGDLSARVELRGHDELARLGTAFNQMASNLQTTVLDLEEEERFLQALIDTIPDGVRILSADHRIVLANRTYWEQLGIASPEHADLRCHASSHGAAEPCPPTLKTCPLHELREGGEPIRFLDCHRRADGSPLEVEVTAAPVTLRRRGREERLVIESIRDLQSQIRFSHEQKLAEIGRLSAGVAHEIHNPLASVRLALSTLREDPEITEQCLGAMGEYLEMVDREVDRCIDVTGRLLRLSVIPPPEPELVVVDTAVQETLSLLFWEADQKGIRLEVSFAAPPLRVLATDSEVRMVALNLAQNAFHAMPDGGTLKVRGERRNGWVQVTIEDSGVGIPAADLEQIFYPFFSRRADGSNGTGLGLFIVRSILQTHHGELEVASTPGQGSRFTFRLPDADQREIDT
jgi:signal transduction histidine kinase/HAMP domain-containing protein